MAATKYAIGVDFGSESGRAVLVDVGTGEEIATAVHAYANGVIDEKIPGTNIKLGPDWALQDPNDYLEVFKRTIPAVMKESRRKYRGCHRNWHRFYSLHNAPHQSRWNTVMLLASLAQ